MLAKTFLQRYLTVAHWTEEYSVLLQIDIGLWGREYCCVSEVTNVATIREFEVIIDVLKSLFMQLVHLQKQIE